MSELLELAERCEVATVADCEEILEDAFRLCFPKPSRVWVTDNTGEWTAEYRDWQQRQCDFYSFLEARAFLNAAVMLVPEGIAWTLDGGDPSCPDSASLGPVPDKGMLLNPKWVGEAETPALALCAAALEARAQIANVKTL